MINWKTFYDQHKLVDYARMLARPGRWQVALAERVRVLAKGGRLLEAGSGLGLTSLLAKNPGATCLLDLEPKATNLARGLFEYARQPVMICQGDLFRMPFADGAFDCVFNAGVLEHFDLAARTAAIQEMTRVTRPGGTVLVAVPNHYARPYRFAYERLVKRGKWRYPLEEKIFDFATELRAIPRISLAHRETVDQETIFHFLKGMYRPLFRMLHLVKRYEGYLTIITFTKTPASDAA